MKEKIPCGGFYYDTESIEFDNGIMKSKGNATSGIPLDGSKPMTGTLQTPGIKGIDGNALHINSDSRGIILSSDNTTGIPEPIMLMNANEVNCYLPLNMDNNSIQGVGTPTLANDVATKGYVDAAIKGAMEKVYYGT